MNYSEKFKSKLAQLICQEIYNQLERNRFRDYQILQTTCEHWTDTHFERAAELSGVSNSTLKRIFKPQNYAHYSFNVRTQKLFCDFLAYTTWEDLVEAIHQELYDVHKK